MLCFFSVSKGEVYFTARTVEVISKSISNVGEAYITSNGVFTVPHSSVYVFIFFLASTHWRKNIGNIVVNGSPKVGDHLRPGIGSSHASVGNSAVFPLVQGDRVWVEYKSRTMLSKQPNAPISTFSKFFGNETVYAKLTVWDNRSPTLTLQKQKWSICRRCLMSFWKINSDLCDFNFSSTDLSKL